MGSTLSVQCKSHNHPTKIPASAAARISILLPTPDTLAEVAEPETDREEARDVPAPDAMLAEPEALLEDADTSTVVIDSVLDAAAGVSELVVVVVVAGENGNKG